MRLLSLGILMLASVLPAMAEDGDKKLELWYNRPAPNRGADFNQVKSRGFPYDEDWEHWSLPIGNGYMGATVFGRTDTERIQLAEKTLATDLYNGGGSFTNFAEIYLDFNHTTYGDYRRSLSLNDGIARVSYRTDSVNYTREYLANYPYNVMAVKIKADKPGAVSFRLRPVIPYLHSSDKGDGRTGKVTANGDLITMSGVMEFFGVAYEAQFKVTNHGGSIEARNDANGDNGTIQINCADSVEIIFTAGTSYLLEEKVFLCDQPKEKCKGNVHPHNAVSERIAAAAKMGYEKLKREHVADYRTYFDRVKLSLTNKVPNIPTDELLYNYKKGKHDRYLEELFFHYGRYLLIASARKGTLPPNLQGAWTQYYRSPWSGGYWHNVNVQMNFWPAFNTNLAELFDSFVAYNETYRKAAQKNACKYIMKNNPQALSGKEGENGWTIGTGASAYRIGAPGGHSGPGTGGFTTKLYWDYYDFTRDKEILEKHTYPALEGMAKFLMKTLQPDGKGHLLAVPSASPENRHNGQHYQTKGCTFDQGMIWENFNDLLNAAQILGKKSAFLDKVKNTIGKLDPVHIGADGQLKEYREENHYSDIGDPKHRHISHLCLLYPGTLINETTPEWLKAARVALTKRGLSAGKYVGWPIAHRQNTWARLKDGETAYKLYNILLSNGTFENLWGSHPPFQIDCNFGGTAGVAEMLLQSHEGYIAPLPALPKAWSDGSYKGLVARGNFEVGVEWQSGKAKTIDILSRSGEICRISYPGLNNVAVKTKAGAKVKTKQIGKDKIEFSTKKNEKYIIEF